MPRRISGSVTEVHKPLGSAGELSGTHDAVLWEDGGALLPKWSPIAKGLRREYARLLRIHGSRGVLPLYKENGLYNFYLQMRGPAKRVELSPFEGSGTPPQVAAAQNASAVQTTGTGSSGKRRQAYWP